MKYRLLAQTLVRRFDTHDAKAYHELLSGLIIAELLFRTSITVVVVEVVFARETE